MKKITRRHFLSWMGAAAGSNLLFDANASAASHKEFNGFPGSLGVLHDISRCIGCRKCEAACNEVNQLPRPNRPFDDLTVLNQIRRTDANSYTVVNRFNPVSFSLPVFVKKQCNHCMEPACVSACFVKALKKSPSGAVVYDASLCVGCRYCMIACPFDIPAYEYNNPFTPKIQKCTLCQSRITKGLQPACVEACPKEALTFGARDDLIKTARLRIAGRMVQYIDHIYGEHEMGGTNWLYIANAEFSNLNMREDLGNIPAPQFTSGPLSMVPVVVSLWVVFLTGLYALTRRKEKIANQELKDAITETRESVMTEMEQKISQLKQKAQEEKNAAIKREVKKALEEAANQPADTPVPQDAPPAPNASELPKPENE